MRSALTILIIFVLTACTNRQEEDTFKNKPLPYFDLASYFEKEAIRLQTRNPLLTKTVGQNGESEKKDIKITDWKSELGFFIASDINKPAWRNSYRVIKKGNKIIYLSKDDGLRTQKIEILSKPHGGIKHISILNQTSNILYTSTEYLNYSPDSFYTINKQQKVLLNSLNTYQIKSEFTNENSNK
ncbi:MAG TPA: hypothetical protein VF602_00335 [Pedobacter sp.]|jgi:hypothetical protein